MFSSFNFRTIEQIKKWKCQRKILIPASPYLKLVDVSNFDLSCLVSINWVDVWHDCSLTSWKVIYLGIGKQKGDMSNYINGRYFAQILTSIVIVSALININWNLLYSVIPYSPVPNLIGPARVVFVVTFGIGEWFLQCLLIRLYYSK